MFSVPINQIEKTIKRFIQEAKINKKKIVKDLNEACDDLFSEWKKTQKDKKKVSNDEIQELINKAENIPGTIIKIISGITTSNATAVAGIITQSNNYIVHIYDGNKLVSMASENVIIDLREIAPEIGKILGGSGGGKPHMTQCGGPNKNKADDALKVAKKLTIEKIRDTKIYSI